MGCRDYTETFILTDRNANRVDQWNQWHEWNFPRYPHSKVVQYVLRNFQEKEASAARALDLGCGSGANTAFLAEIGFDVDAVDIPPIAVDRTKQLLYGRGLGAQVDVADIEQFEFQPAIFDLVVSVGVLEFVDNASLAELLQRMRHALTSNGRMVHVFAADGDFRQTSAVVRELGMRFRTLAEVREVVARVESIRLDIDQYITTYDSGTSRQVDWLLTGMCK